MAKVFRKYDEQAATVICGRLAQGETLTRICKSKEMPKWDTVQKWVLDVPKFAEMYARARELQAEYYFDLLVDESTEIQTETSATVQAAKLRIETIKWAVSKLLPRKYGDKLAIGGADDLPPVKTDSTLSPGDAYLKMLGGGS